MSSEATCRSTKPGSEKDGNDSVKAKRQMKLRDGKRCIGQLVSQEEIRYGYRKWAELSVVNPARRRVASSFVRTQESKGMAARR